MTGLNNKIIVSCDITQKNQIEINGILFKTALEFEKNYREKSPTIATVIEGNDIVTKGDILLCHHNLFYLPSPYHLHGMLYSIPFSKILFARIDTNGNIAPICGNLICNRIPVIAPFQLPDEEPKFNDKMYQIVDGGNTEYKKGEIVLTRPSSGYDIVYVWNNEEIRITKVDKDMVCGVVTIFNQ